ncbi:hypothetical protein NAF17_07430 [Mucilaginibacter sp. RB4R14]|nr:hypothetical protein [Mucilaginibacter aurantiaciroseus]MCO5935367.1 hypothetical protein [Mucilaginibacter aurantiaciroseus]
MFPFFGVDINHTLFGFAAVFRNDKDSCGITVSYHPNIFYCAFNNGSY